MSEKTTIAPVISNKPFSVPIEMRPLWRISLILISISIVGGSKRYLNVSKVNMLVWMLIRQKRWDEYRDFLLGRSLDLPLVSADTATFKSVEFAIAKDFVSLKESRLYLSDRGEDICQLIEDNSLMFEERSFLESVGKKLTDAKIKAITGGLV